MISALLEPMRYDLADFRLQIDSIDATVQHEIVDIDPVYIG